ncbi:ATP-binding protein [Bifidobacterium vansinderenii]|uniref:P-loop containing region of AAA domain-containing protein n=1 Tax=Bifidobacterium vansinderenii TaxID=1984871 RepID=A0A229W092_9BIFI|nr:SbcC/MukB-like Walker B domain-containing protein [Bifidobacterium vansinderenii]OXN01271.1 P-loop containing region of AAA domain-containing protein [Bifidobacterium vansinderenii]
MPSDMQIIADRWMLNSRRIVNWGSYDGYHEFRPSTDDRLPVTLLAGASESGKSTLVDAQISLLYPTGTPFNKASNAGRSERSDYTYLRGMLGYGNSGGGDVPVFLRGRGNDGTPQPVWGAIVDTYVNRTTGQTLSCGKFLYLSAGDGQGEVRRQYVTWDHAIDPRLMDRYRDTPFTPTQLKNTYDGCDTFPNADVFHAHIWRIMGLSAEACRLLHKLQSADAPSRLDDIFKQGVLGVPKAIELAQAAVADYERYDANFRSMEEKAKRIAKLKDIQTSHDVYVDAVQQERAFTAVDPDDERQGHATVAAWVTSRMTGEVRAQLPLDELALQRQEQELESLQRKVNDLQERVTQIESQMQERDGGNLSRLETELEQAEHALDDVKEQRKRVQARFTAAGETMPTDRQSWEECRVRLAALDADLAQHKAELEERRNTAVETSGGIKRELAVLRRDYERQRTQRTRISQPMDEARALIAKATGLSVAELPYVAELMDVREDAEEWRNAMNVVYGQLAQTILVDKRHEPGFAAKVSAIDPKLMVRRTWTFVDTTRDYISDSEKAWMSGKLRYREDSPFADWLKSQTCSERLDALCVDAIDDEDRSTRQVQRDGQVKSGKHGHHGSKGMHPVIGFVTEAYLEELHAQIADAEARLTSADDEYRTANADLETLRAKETLAEQLSYTPWDKVDVDGAERRIADLEATIDAIRNDPELARLLDIKQGLVRELDEAREHAVEAKMTRQGTEQAIQSARRWLEAHAPAAASDSHAARASEEGTTIPVFADDVRQVLDAAYERAFSSVLNHDDRAHVIVMAAAGAGETDADDTGKSFVARTVASVENDLRQRIGMLRAGVSSARSAVEDRMATYCELYVPDDDTVTATVGDYRFYQEELKSLALLAAVNATNEEYVNCLDKMLMDFTQLNRAIDADARDIGDQLDKINAMLRGQQFGPKHGSLSIGADVRRPEAAFTGPLKRTMVLLNEWKAGGVSTPEENRRVFARCSGLVNRLRTELEQVRDANGIRSYGARNLDPRCRSSFYAVVHHEDGEDERITSTGGKSGGALQELTSFVYGAALIYLLGGDVTGQPTYTTLFLDEALIKADGRYTQRALSVLPRLGFQVIVSAPESKTAEILEVSSKAYVAYKDPDTSRSYLQEVLLDDVRSEQVSGGETAA